MDTNLERCVFCQIVGGAFDEKLIAYRDQSTCVFPSLHQRDSNRGHMLVIPAPHVRSIYDLEKDLGAELMHMLSRTAKVVKHAFEADGIAIKQHNDRHGGQDVFHVHFHVIPCFEGDGFFRGNNRFPKGMKEVPLVERIEQANRVREGITIG